MSHANLLDQDVVKLIPENVDQLNILDVGCGFGWWGFQIRVQKEGNPLLIGLDIWKPYMEKVKKMRIYDELIRADIRKIPFRHRIFDIVIACEVLEHLPRADGFKLLRELERVCRCKILLSTPLGFMEQDEINNNPYERHVSAWRAEDFTKLGYDVQIVDGRPLPKTLKLVDEVRRFVFNLPEPFREIIAWKEF